MVPNVESVYGITSKVVTTTIGVNRSPRERIFLQKSNSSSWLLRNFGFKIRNYHKNCRASKFKYPCQKAGWRVPRHSLVPGYKYLSSRTFWVVQLPQLLLRIYLSTCGSWSYRAKIKIWNLVWIAEIQVCSCVGYTENQKFDLLQDEFQIKSPNYHSPNACYMFNFKPGIRVVNLECVCEISMLPTSTTYLEVLEMSTVCSIMVEKFKFPAVGYLPWPICRFKKFKTKIAHKIEKIRETAITSSPPLVWLSLSFLPLILGIRRLAAEEGTFSKKTWVQKIKSGSWWAPCGPDFRVMDRRDPGTNGCLGIQWFGIWNV